MGGPSHNTFHAEKVALLSTLAPLFPDVCETDAQLRAIEAAYPHQHQWLQRHFSAMQRIYLPLWRSLGPAYVASLSQSIGGDPVPLVAQVEIWPETWTGHQEALHQLLEESRLREGWRNYTHLVKLEHSHTDGRQQLGKAEQELRQSSAPLREIPLYQSFMRTSCQQIVVLPVDQWRVMQTHDLEANKQYRPQDVNAAVVDRLAYRVAQVFNAPPFVDVALLEDSPGWCAPVVWSTNPGQLTNPINCHGMRDRVESVEEHDAVPMLPVHEGREWRYEGFFGLLRVTTEDEADWMVAVLAPMHFVRSLAHSVHWYGGHVQFNRKTVS